jgi:hypothetical protein
VYVFRNILVRSDWSFETVRKMGERFCKWKDDFLSHLCFLRNVWARAHRSFKLSDRSKAMSDPWFSERKEKSVERRANCQKKEFANRLKRSLNLKERSTKRHFEQFALERCKVKRVDNPLLETGILVSCFPAKSRCELGDHSWHN